MPDEAREVIFHQGLPIYRAEQSKNPTPVRDLDGPDPDVAEDDLRTSTIGEANLSNDSEPTVCEDRSPDGPKAEENLLDNPDDDRR